jgi:hypothetical protein
MGRKYQVKLRDWIEGLIVEPYIIFKITIKNLVDRKEKE